MIKKEEVWRSMEELGVVKIKNIKGGKLEITGEVPIITKITRNKEGNLTVKISMHKIKKRVKLERG